MHASLTRHLSRPTVRLNLLALGLTAVFVGYFLIWLPGPGTGLQLIGVELGEWIKFLGVGPRRDLFYLPPIALGLVLTLWTAHWPNGRWETWAARGLAVAVAILAFPAVAAITMEPRSEWLLRLVLIGLVAVTALLSAVLAARPGPKAWLWLVMAAVAAVGALAPAWQYLVVRPVVESALHQPVGIGPGVWLNALGGLLVASVCFVEFITARRERKKRQPPDGRLSADALQLER